MTERVHLVRGTTTFFQDSVDSAMARDRCPPFHESLAGMLASPLSNVVQYCDPLELL